MLPFMLKGLFTATAKKRARLWHHENRGRTIITKATTSWSFGMALCSCKYRLMSGRDRSGAKARTKASKWRQMQASVLYYFTWTSISISFCASFARAPSPCRMWTIWCVCMHMRHCWVWLVSPPMQFSLALQLLTCSWYITEKNPTELLWRSLLSAGLCYSRLRVLAPLEQYYFWQLSPKAQKERAWIFAMQKRRDLHGRCWNDTLTAQSCPCSVKHSYTCPYPPWRHAKNHLKVHFEKQQGFDHSGLGLDEGHRHIVCTHRLLHHDPTMHSTEAFK